MPALMKPISEIRDQLDRVFNELTEDFVSPLSFSEWKPFRLLQNGERLWTPAIEVSETEQNYVIKAEVPGMKPEDIQVDVMGNVVTLQGETRQEKKEEKHNVYRSEFRYGQFYRQIPLPTDINADASKAEFKNGVLYLTLPKTQESKRKRISVQAEAQKKS